MAQPTPDMFRGLARSSPWRWRALSFELHRRPLHGPDHTVVGRLVRGVGLEVALPDGERRDQGADRGSYGWVDTDSGDSGTSEMQYAWELPVEIGADGFVLRRPQRPTADDPMWQDYQFVAMLDPVELADGMPRDPRPDWDPDAPRPPALDLHRLDVTTRLGRTTWWAEVSPREDYDPRCGCCPLLFGRVSEDVEAQAGGPRLLEQQPDLTYATAYLVALDVQTGVCVHVEHLDGTFVGRGFSLDVLGVDDDMPSRASRS
ncbi:MAG: hypothetical protein ABI187_08365, partial [Ornithinibacter sp.]